MSRVPNQNGSDCSINWEYFIGHNKAASPQFDELCRGLASVIRKLEPARDFDLSPNRLANFYRACGADFDELFKNTGEHGLSFLYRTLGCYHSLQPTRNAFEAPSIPCLTEDGYVRWQTLQLLLCPDEHAAIVQKAVELYDVPRRAGIAFPKTVPRECFPARPDADMEKWHRFVTSQINADHYQRRLKFSPYQSPNIDGINSSGGYFPKAPPVRRPSNVRRGESRSDEELARLEAAREAARRRSSVPDIASPGGTLYSEKEAARKTRSRSANRPVSDGHRYQPPPGPDKVYTPASNHRSSHSVSSHRHSSSSVSVDRSSGRNRRSRRDASSGSRVDTASDVSSEDSYHARPPRPAEEENSQRRTRWGTSLMPSFFLSNSKRRHSSDGRVPTLQDQKRSPRRGNSIRKYRTEAVEQPPPNRQFDPPQDRASSNVRFVKVPSNSGPAQRPSETAHQQPIPPPSSYRYPEPQPYFPPPQAPGSNVPNIHYIQPTPPPLPLQTGPGQPVSMTSNHFEARKQGVPIRLSTVSGVNGRRYAPSDARNNVDPSPVMTNRRHRTSSMRQPAMSTTM
ncbi:hypothetical protein LTS08_005503 [Lithohypha guttulata]|nr:hypothetical protein LTS08_005503 [Lithohypha guttulata]